MGSPLAGLIPRLVDVAIRREFFSKYHEPDPCDRKLYFSRLGCERSLQTGSTSNLILRNLAL